MKNVMFGFFWIFLLNLTVSASEAKNPKEVSKKPKVEVSKKKMLTTEQKQKIAYKLAMLLRSARSVVSSNKSVISDPKTLPKDFVEQSKKVYRKVAGSYLDEDSDEVTNLIKAIKTVTDEARAGKYKNNWPSGEFAGKFLPARFAMKVSEKFTELSKGKTSMKLTAPPKLIVNKNNAPDDWEIKAIKQFLKPGWGRDQPFFEATDKGFRSITPEYYNSTCMKCHSGEVGKRIHAGKISGIVGGVGGAISLFFKN